MMGSFRRSHRGASPPRSALATDGIEQRLGHILHGWGKLSVVPLR